MIKEVNDHGFKNEVLASSIPVVVDFWAPWCGPCRMLGPVLEAVEKQYGEKVTFVKVNVDDNPKTSEKYSIYSVPTVMLFNNGTASETLVGFMPKRAVEEVIKKYI